MPLLNFAVLDSSTVSPRVTCVGVQHLPRWHRCTTAFENGNNAVSIGSSSLLHVGNWGITFAMLGGHGRAAGCRGRPADQRCGDDASNEADTAQPPSPRTPEGLQLCMEHHRPPTCTYTYAHLKYGLTFQLVIGWRLRCLIARLYIRGEGK